MSLHEDEEAALEAIRGANPGLAEDWRGPPSAGWRGLKRGDDGAGLAELMLDACGLVALPPQVAALTGLRKLWLSNNGLRVLPDEISCLVGLHSLWLGNNLLRTLPAGVSCLGALKQLWLPSNNMAELPEAVCRLPALEWLDASENKLTSVPAAIAGLTSLNRLDLHSNSIATLPEEIGQLHQVRHLSLHFNALEALPPGIGGCTALVWLSLNANRLTALPDELCGLTQLVRISLHINELASLPAGIGALTALEAVSLHKNRLAALPPGVGRFAGASRLSLYENQLTSIPPELGNMAALEELWLYSNQLTELPPELGRLRALRKLWVDRNALQRLPEELGDCSALQELYLDHNQLRTLPLSLTRLANLRRLYLEGNPDLVVPPELAGLPALAARDYGEAPAGAAAGGVAAGGAPPLPPLEAGLAGLALGGGGAGGGAAPAHQEFLLDPARFVEQQDKYARAASAARWEAAPSVAAAELGDAPALPAGWRGMAPTQKMNILDLQPSSLPAIGGHRGMGANVIRDGALAPAWRENTLRSFQAAAASGAAFVEFDVQVTADGVPVVWHDDVVEYGDPSQPTTCAVASLTAAEFQALGALSASGNCSQLSVVRRFKHAGAAPGGGGGDAAPAAARAGPGRQRWRCEADDAFPTLEQLFATLPGGLAFNIEVKLATPPELAATPAAEIARMVGPILDVVSRAAAPGAPAPGRQVVFSSFDPDVCRALAAAQRAHAVLLLSTGGRDWHADARRMSIAAAVDEASDAALSGVVVDSGALKQAPEAAGLAARRGLKLLTYGLENDDPGWVLTQQRLGVAGVIVDDLSGLMRALGAAAAGQGAAAAAAHGGAVGAAAAAAAAGAALGAAGAAAAAAGMPPQGAPVVSAPRARPCAGRSAARAGARVTAPDTDTGTTRAGRAILLAVDDGPDSEHALDWALTHLARRGDRLELVHCLPPPPAPGRLAAAPGGGLLRVPRVDPALLTEKARVHADGALRDKLMARLAAAGAEGTFTVLPAPGAGASAGEAKACVGAAVCDRAKAASAAAVVVASTSRGGLREALLGSVAASLVHECAAVPVVVLHRPQGGAGGAGGGGATGADEARVEWLLRATTQDLAESTSAGGTGDAAQQDATRHLVLAVDDGAEGAAALRWVLAHLHRPGDLLHLLHVVPALPAYMTPSLAPDGMLYGAPLPQVEEAQAAEDEWRALLLERLGPLLAAAGASFQLDVLTDYGADPLSGVGGAVVAAAERLRAAALVVCGHSHGTAADWLLGSPASAFALERIAMLDLIDTQRVGAPLDRLDRCAAVLGRAARRCCGAAGRGAPLQGGPHITAALVGTPSKPSGRLELQLWLEAGEGAPGGSDEAEESAVVLPPHVAAAYALQSTDLRAISKKYVVACPDCGRSSPPLSSRKAVQQFVADHVAGAGGSGGGPACRALRAAADAGAYARAEAFGEPPPPPAPPAPPAGDAADAAARAARRRRAAAASADAPVEPEVRALMARLIMLVSLHVVSRTDPAPRKRAGGGGGAGAPPPGDAAAQLQPWRDWAVSCLSEDVDLLEAANWVRPSLRSLSLPRRPSLLEVLLALPYVAIAEPGAGKRQVLEKLAVLLAGAAPGGARGCGPAGAGAALEALLSRDAVFGSMPPHARLPEFLALAGLGSVAEVAEVMGEPFVSPDHLEVCAVCGLEAKALARGQGPGPAAKLRGCAFCIVCVCGRCAAGGGAADSGSDGSPGPGAPPWPRGLCPWCQVHPDTADFEPGGGSAAAEGAAARPGGGSSSNSPVATSDGLGPAAPAAVAAESMPSAAAVAAAEAAVAAARQQRLAAAKPEVKAEPGSPGASGGTSSGGAAKPPVGAPPAPPPHAAGEAAAAVARKRSRKPVKPGAAPPPAPPAAAGGAAEAAADAAADGAAERRPTRRAALKAAEKVFCWTADGAHVPGGGSSSSESSSESGSDTGSDDESDGGGGALPPEVMLQLMSCVADAAGKDGGGRGKLKLPAGVDAAALQGMGVQKLAKLLYAGLRQQQQQQPRRGGAKPRGGGGRPTSSGSSDGGAAAGDAGGAGASSRAAPPPARGGGWAGELQLALMEEVLQLGVDAPPAAVQSALQAGGRRVGRAQVEEALASYRAQLADMAGLLGCSGLPTGHALVQLQEAAIQHQRGLVQQAATRRGGAAAPPARAAAPPPPRAADAGGGAKRRASHAFGDDDDTDWVARARRRSGTRPKAPRQSGARPSAGAGASAQARLGLPPPACAGVTVTPEAVAAAEAAANSIAACVMLLRMVPGVDAAAKDFLGGIESRSRRFVAAYKAGGLAADAAGLQVLLKVVTALTTLHEDECRPLRGLVACLAQDVPEGYAVGGGVCTGLDLLLACWLREAAVTGVGVDASEAAAAAGPVASAFATDMHPGSPISLNCFLAGMSQLALAFLAAAAKAREPAPPGAGDGDGGGGDGEDGGDDGGDMFRRVLAVEVLSGTAVLMLHWPDGAGCHAERCVQAGLWRQRLLSHGGGRELGAMQEGVREQLQDFLIYLARSAGLVPPGAE
ncbi:LRRC1 [Scenedesmus sp. PABB004]|nr:LRRC1 [Scenedesmus sp. PABB004]